jgi:hypothetical protein
LVLQSEVPWQQLTVQEKANCTMLTVSQVRSYVFQESNIAATTTFAKINLFSSHINNLAAKLPHTATGL